MLKFSECVENVQLMRVKYTINAHVCSASMRIFDTCHTRIGATGAVSAGQREESVKAARSSTKRCIPYQWRGQWALTSPYLLKKLLVQEQIFRSLRL